MLLPFNFKIFFFINFHKITLQFITYTYLHYYESVYFIGKLASMKHLKDEVTTIKRDMECGLRFEDPDFTVQPGDTIVCYKMADVADTTSWDPGF